MQQHKDVFELLVYATLVIWISGLGIAIIVRRSPAYMQWTGNALSGIFRHAWQFILGVLVGYFILHSSVIT